MIARIALVLTAGALAGCAQLTGNAPAASATNRGAAAHVDENLARLRALDVFTVGRLIVEVSAAASSCSGPCPGAEAAVNRAQLRSAVRLAQLADTAERAAASPLPDACAQPAVDANLATLAALRIVRVSGLVVTPPANNPQCNDTPCPTDVAAAAAATCARAGRLAAIAAAATGL